MLKIFHLHNYVSFLASKSSYITYNLTEILEKNVYLEEKYLDQYQVNHKRK